MVRTLPLRKKISLTTIVVTVLMVVAMSSTVFSIATAPVAFGQRIVNDSEQAVIAATTNSINQNNNTIDRNTSALRIIQSAENGLDAECEGDLICEILGNNTLTASNTGQNTTTDSNMTITSSLDTLNQSLTQSVNQSSIPLLPFGDNDFDDMLNNDFDIFNEQEEDLDSEIDEWIDRMLNGTLGDMRAPLQTSPDLRSVSV
jgi:hypothetical protein